MKTDQLQKIFELDDRIVEVREYLDGFVPMAYRWPCYGTRVHYSLDGSVYHQSYDRKRPHGRGPAWVAVSKAGGRLVSSNTCH